MKLYPPYIEGTIPAFYRGTGEDSALLTVPFVMNRAVNKTEIKGFYLKLKTVQSNMFKFSIFSESYNTDSPYEVYFTLSKEQCDSLRIGQYYKIQIAYQHVDGTVGYYSTVATVKYTTKPQVTIEGLNPTGINLHTYSYTGHYSQYTDNLQTNPTDTSEKAYYYKFKLINKDADVVEETEYFLHNTSEDENTYESFDSYKMPSDLPLNQVFYLQYIVKTNNDLEVSSPKYRVIQKSSIAPELDAKLVANLNYDNGYITLDLITTGATDKAVSGSFLISRGCRDDGYKVWDEIMYLTLRGEHVARGLWKDFTIEQGKYYTYSLQQFNDAGIYSSRMLTEEIYADFEDAFLYDGERQLKIKYNPKISSFKTDLLETKVDTIGSKYPFIFRNGRVEYKEFPIAGLISYQSDEENLFMTDEELGFNINPTNLHRQITINEPADQATQDYFKNLQNRYDKGLSLSKDDRTQIQGYMSKKSDVEKLTNGHSRTFNLTGDNYSAEREFKLAALDWLNNGKPKLFRSPSEGNYLVRLMNISLSPEDNLGRLLHTFSATAYEMAEYSYQALKDFNVLQVEELVTNVQTNWVTIPLTIPSPETTLEQRLEYKEYGNLYYKDGELLGHGRQATTLRLTDMAPGEQVIIRQFEHVPQTIYIGSTGTYEINNLVDPIVSIQIASALDASGHLRPGFGGLITYSYNSNEVAQFNTITNINIEEVPIKQFIGDSTKQVGKVILKTDLAKYPGATVEDIDHVNRYIYIDYQSGNILDQINNFKETFDSFYFLRFAKRPVEQAYFKFDEQRLYKDAARQITLVPKLHPTYVSNENYGQAVGVNNNVVQSDVDPFALYRYELPWLDSLQGLIAWENLNARDFDIYKHKESFIWGKVDNANYIYEPQNSASVFDENRQYYRAEPWVCYFDPYKPSTLFIDPESYSRMKELYGAAAAKRYQQYSCKIAIDGHVLDLADIETYQINHEIYLDSIELDCGVALECGYEIQSIDYSLENTAEFVLYKQSVDTLYDTVQKIRKGESTDDYDTAVAAYREAWRGYLKRLEIVKTQKDEEAELS